MIHKTKNNWLFFKQSKACYLCQQHPAFKAMLCQGCFNDMPWLKQTCYRCALPLISPTDDPALCSECFKHPPPFDQVIAAFEYRFPVDQLIQAVKFRQQNHYLKLLAELLLQKLNGIDEGTDQPDMLIPVPMDHFRLLERQYNHSALLCRIIANRLNLKYSSQLLIKPASSVQQLGLDRKERQRNLRNMFRCSATPPPHIAVIDDVVTTGATAMEIARTLKRAGAEQVDIWSVARTGKGGYL